jgi:hypothetical protein
MGGAPDEGDDADDADGGEDATGAEGAASEAEGGTWLPPLGSELAAAGFAAGLATEAGAGVASIDFGAPAAGAPDAGLSPAAGGVAGLIVPGSGGGAETEEGGAT